jgi:glucan 1,3-beta-glucosidase
MQWNIKEISQGSVGMWDVIFRVGGATGTGLTESTCHQFGKQAIERYFPCQRVFFEMQLIEHVRCMASSMMLHVTSSASIYMENMWFWVAGKDRSLRKGEKMLTLGRS